MNQIETPVMPLNGDDWEASHAALVGRRSAPSSVPPSGEFWAGPVKAEITREAEGFRWFLVSGDGRFQLAQSPMVFHSQPECEQHLRSFSPSVQLTQGVVNYLQANKLSRHAGSILDNCAS